MLDGSGDMSPRLVTHSLTTTLIGRDGDLPLEVELHYDPRCPYAATALFRSGVGTVSWTFARDLLWLGLFEPVGSGDIHVRPDIDEDGRAAVLMELRSPQGLAVVSAPAREIHRFVQCMTDTVHPGTESEHLDIDAAIDQFLASASD